MIIYFSRKAQRRQGKDEIIFFTTKYRRTRRRKDKRII